MFAYYAVVSTVAFWMLFSIWNRNGLLNTVIKIVLLGFALVGSFVALQTLGYVVPQ